MTKWFIWCILYLDNSLLLHLFCIYLHVLTYYKNEGRMWSTYCLTLICTALRVPCPCPITHDNNPVTSADFSGLIWHYQYYYHDHLKMSYRITCKPELTIMMHIVFDLQHKKQQTTINPAKSLNTRGKLHITYILLSLYSPGHSLNTMWKYWRE